MIIKNLNDLNKLKQAGKILSSLFKEIEGRILPNISADELNNFIEFYIYSFKAIPAFKGYNGYKYASNISINNEVVHGLPTKEKIFNLNDVVKVDIGISYEGFIVDSARTFYISNNNDQRKKLINDTKNCLEYLLNNIKVGTNILDISQQITSYGLLRGYFIPPEIGGHGVGKVLHEKPFIPNFLDMRYPSDILNYKLAEGEVIALEPIFLLKKSNLILDTSDQWTIYAEDKEAIAAHFEHTILVTSTGVEILT